MSAEIKLKIIVGIMCGITLGIPFTPIVCLMRHLFIVPFRYKKMLNKAIEQGHVVKAKLIKVKDAAGEGGHGQLFHQEILYVDYLMMVIYMIQLDLFYMYIKKMIL